MIAGLSFALQKARLPLFALAGVLTLSGAQGAEREKVQFSNGGQGKSSAAPAAKDKDSISRPMDAIPKKDVTFEADLSLLNFQQGHGALSKDSLKLLDKKQNWIFDNSKNADRDAELKAVLGVKDTSFTSFHDDNSKGVMGEYFDGPSRQVRRAGPEDEESSQTDAAGLSKNQNPFQSMRLPSLAPATPMMNGFGQQSVFGNVFGNVAGRSESSSSLNGKKPERSGIEKLLSPWKGSAGETRDSLELQVDAGKQPINPVVGTRNLGTTPFGAPLTPGSLIHPTFGAAPGASTFGRPSSISSLFSGSGNTPDGMAAPIFKAPEPTLPMRPQPAVLPIPKRKF